jgi:DNA-binding IclR family transcriptional regulator
LEDYYCEHLNFQALSERSGIPKATLYRWIRTFEAKTLKCVNR